MPTSTEQQCGAVRIVTTLTIIALSVIATVASALEIPEAEPNNDFAGAQNVDHSFSVGPQYGIENAETWPWVSIRGSGDGTFDYYSFVVPAGNVDGIFDIDFTLDLDSWLDLYRELSDGTFALLASKDDSDLLNDEGSRQGESTLYFWDSRLYYMFTFPEPGTYVIRVGRFGGPQPLNSGQAYTLNITLGNHEVADDESPTIACPPNQSVQCAAEIPAADFAGGTVSDNRPGVIVRHVADTVTPGNCPNRLILTRIYRAIDASDNTADCTQLITVSDTTAPVLSGCPAPTASYQCLADVPLPVVVTAVDNCSGAVAVQFSETQSNPGSSCDNVITRTWTATDACGNPASCTQTIAVNDTAPPVITCPPDLIVAIGPVPPAAMSVQEFVAQGGTVTDNCDITSAVTSSDLITGSCPTVITRTYVVTDRCGNASVWRQTITVGALFGSDAVIWYWPFVRSGLSRDTDPSGGGTLRYPFEVGRTVRIRIHAVGCGGADVTGNPSVIGTVELFSDVNCDGLPDGDKLPIHYDGVGGPDGMMPKIDGRLKYNLDTDALPRTSQCYILRVTVTDTSTGESRSETVPLQGVVETSDDDDDDDDGDDDDD